MKGKEKFENTEIAGTFKTQFFVGKTVGDSDGFEKQDSSGRTDRDAAVGGRLERRMFMGTVTRIVICSGCSGGRPPGLIVRGDAGGRGRRVSVLTIRKERRRGEKAGGGGRGGEEEKEEM